MKGIIHSFESLAAVDGEGLRFAVFLAGCPLRCVYCHNPDTWEKKGREISPEELCQKALRYRTYFGEQGGVTFTGGEPLLQSAFLLETVRLLNEEKVRYVLDTSGAIPLDDRVGTLLKGAQEVLLDLKFWDDFSYRRYAGVGIDSPLKTLDFLEREGIPTVIRTVVIPEINDDPSILKRYKALFAGKSCVREWELLPFHTLGFHKYEALSLPNPLRNTSALSPERLAELKHAIKE